MPPRLVERDPGADCSAVSFHDRADVAHFRRLTHSAVRSLHQIRPHHTFPQAGISSTPTRRFRGRTSRSPVRADFEKRLWFNAICSTVSYFGSAELWIGDGAESSADHIESRAPNSPKRRPRRTSELRALCCFSQTISSSASTSKTTTPRATSRRTAGTPASEGTPRSASRLPPCLAASLPPHRQSAVRLCAGPRPSQEAPLWTVCAGHGGATLGFRYDVPQCAPGTAVENCTHVISGVVTPPGERMHFIGAHYHCHAPTCLRMEIYNNVTGELLCAEEPYHGTNTLKARPGDPPPRAHASAPMRRCLRCCAVVVDHQDDAI